MFILRADKNRLILMRREPITSGSVNVNRVRFEFSADWKDLTRAAVFKSGEESVLVLLDDTNECVLPWELLTEHGRQVKVGVYGTLENDVILPTIWANLGNVLQGTTVGEKTHPPTSELYEKIMAVLTEKQDKLVGLPGQVVGFDEAGNAVAQDLPSGGGAGTMDHRSLDNLEAEDQHPIKAITGLEDALQRIPAPMTAAQLQNILYGGQENV